MTPREKPPAPVVVAMVLFELCVAVVFLISVVGIFYRLWPLVLLAALAAFAGFSTGQGLWRGWRGSRVFLIVVGVFLVLAGLSVPEYGLFGLVAAGFGMAMAVLLVVPASSRAWFAVRQAPPRRPR
ncbi:hypothetical protein [Nonomuraea sp. SBT364]|uniref:hypothetical protein n=1 Tax=Nonomuraea sp. SBT364 TaxID=1580530 RepID=UPI00066DB323|nr:hypothetical protein [Nonomuraea sp. SBT364]